MSTHKSIMTFLSLMTGPTPAQCVADGLDSTDSFQPIVTEIFSNGCCGNLALMLRMAFGGEIYKSSDQCHIVTKIGERMYDITGDVTGKYSDLVPITEAQLHDQDYVNNYSFDLRGPIV